MKKKTKAYKILLGIDVFCLLGIVVMGIDKQFSAMTSYIVLAIIMIAITFVFKKKGKSHIIIENNDRHIIHSSEELKSIADTVVNLNRDEYSEPLYKEIIDFVLETKHASASLLQRRFKLGYNRAARIIDLLEEDGIIGSQNGSAPRKVLIDKVEYVNSETEKQQIIEHNQFEATLNNEEVIEDALKRFDIKPSYENDGKVLKKIKNMLLTKTSDDEANYFINKLIKYNSPKTLKLAIIDNKIDLAEYNGLPHLKAPVVKGNDRISRLLSVIAKDIEERYELLSYSRYKNIYDYNEKQEDKMPDIYIVINEMYDVLSDSNLKEYITHIAMTEGKLGIKIIGFSKFNRRYLNLGLLEDLFKVYDKYDIDSLFDSAKKEIDMSVIDNDMDGFDFEKYSKELLSANGFNKITVTKSSNDFGADVIAYKDNVKYAIQCKKYSSPVGISAVQEIIASKTMNDCHVAVVLTNNTFTRSSKELADKNNVLLWDRTELKKMMIKLEENNNE